MIHVYKAWHQKADSVTMFCMVINCAVNSYVHIISQQHCNVKKATHLTFLQVISIKSANRQTLFNRPST